MTAGLSATLNNVKCALFAWFAWAARHEVRTNSRIDQLEEPIDNPVHEGREALKVSEQAILHFRSRLMILVRGVDWARPVSVGRIPCVRNSRGYNDSHSQDCERYDVSH